MHLPHPYRRLRKRLGRAGAIAALVLGIAASSALAYYTVNYLLVATGSSTQTNATTGGVQGTANAVTLFSSWTPALAPGTTDPLLLFASNNDPAHTYKLANLTATVSVDATHQTAGCSPSWFSVNLSTADGGSGAALHAFNLGTQEDLPIGAAGIPVGDTTGTITFAAQNVDQSACEGASVTVALSAGTVTTP